MAVSLTAIAILSSCGGSSNDGVATSEPTAQEIQDLIDSGQVDEIAEASGVSEACVELSLAMAASSGAMMPGSDEATIDVDALNRSFDAIKSQAPEDLRDDIEIVKKAMAEYMAVLAEYGNDFSAMMMDPEASERFSSVFDDENFAVAADRFSQWLSEVCAD